MKEWVDHLHAETALSSILSCVDEQTTNQTLAQNKFVINSIVTIVNTFANTNPSPGQNFYYNQSRPPMPPLCSPFDTNVEDRERGSWELSIGNASSSITSDYCPPLECNLRVVNAGLGMISVRVLLCLVLWIFYANHPQREEVFADPHRPQVKDLNSGNGFDNDRSNDETKRYAEVV
ncbi:hypothetical protein Bca101_006867 [Brassica carinata]